MEASLPVYPAEYPSAHSLHAAAASPATLSATANATVASSSSPPLVSSGATSDTAVAALAVHILRRYVLASGLFQQQLPSTRHYQEVCMAALAR